LLKGGGGAGRGGGNKLLASRETVNYRGKKTMHEQQGGASEKRGMGRGGLGAKNSIGERE